MIVQIAAESEVDQLLVREGFERLNEPGLKISEAAIAGGEAGGHPDLLCVAGGANAAAALAQIERGARITPRPVIAALNREWPAPLVRQTLKAGADELLTLPVSADDLALLMLKLRERRSALRRGDRRARVYSVIGLAGGAGTSTVSANLALALHYRLGQRVALVDLDLQNGGLNAALHLEPPATPLSLSGPPAGLDSLKLEAALSKHPAGIYVLAAPAKMEDADLVSDAAVGSVIDLMRQLFDVVIVDCGRRVNEHAVTAWERSNELLYVIDPSLWSARRMPRFMEFFAAIGLRELQPRLVVNRFERRRGVALEELARAAQCEVSAALPSDGAALARVQLAAGDLWRSAPGSRLARAFEDLAERLQPPDRAGRTKPGWMSRLRGAFSVGA